MTGDIIDLNSQSNGSDIVLYRKLASFQQALEDLDSLLLDESPGAPYVSYLRKDFDSFYVDLVKLLDTDANFTERSLTT